jgi:hypothetical protein
VDSPDPLNVVAKKEVADAAQRVVEAAVADLPRGQQRAVREHAEGHLICGLLAVVVQVLAPIAEAESTIGEAVEVIATPKHASVTDIVAAKLLMGIVSWVVEAAGQGVLVKAMAVVKVLRGFAVASCPDVDRHDLVAQECLAPLAGEQVNNLTPLGLDEVAWVIDDPQRPTARDGRAH